VFNPDAVLNAIENELVHFNTFPQSSPIFSDSMQILLEKTWLHATAKWECDRIDIPVLLTTMINIRDSIFPCNVSEALYCDIDEAEKILISFSGKKEYS
ncbi:TPA: type VI secretion system ATPase TssH, partial [Escherichia coli]|nr:type VI secretion system ATPase TssH [Escherichia coli]